MKITFGLNPRSFARAVRLATLLAVVGPLLAGCITVEGQSSREMKTGMLNSFLFRSADIFYPDGPPSDPDRLPDLKPQQVGEIETIFAATVDGLKKLHVQQRDALSGVFEYSVPANLKTQFTLTNTGQPYARIDPKGDILIDVKVAQAIYRTALLAGLKDEGVGGLRFMDWDKENLGKRATTEAEHIEQFLLLKQKVVALPGRTMIGDFAGMFKDDSFKGGWHEMADIGMISVTVERHYFGPIQFLLAHELGHSALGHLEKRKSIADNDCEALQDLELEADAYASFLLSSAMAKSGLLGFDFFGIKDSIGFEDFFKYTYELSGFEQTAGAKTCGHPPIGDRLKVVEAIYKAIQEAAQENTAKLMDSIMKEAIVKERGSQ